MTDDEPSTEEYAWVHQAYTAFPAAAPKAIDRAVAATRAAVTNTASVHSTAAEVNARRPGGRMPWVRWSPWIALMATLCIVILWGERWHRTNLARNEVITLLSQTRLSSATVPPASSHRHTRAPIDTRGSSTAPTVPTPLDAPPEEATASAPLLTPSPTSTVAPSLSSSHERAVDGRAVDGLDATSTTVAVRLLDSAQARGLPIEGVVARIHEGVRRGASSQQIIVVAQNYVASLDGARAALGASATAAELQAGAEALQAGTPPGALQQLRAARPAGSLVESLIALADLSTHGVAPLQASTALAALVARDGSDTRVRALRTAVIGDIVRGMLPDAALAYRTRQSASKNLQQTVGDGADSIPRRSP